MADDIQTQLRQAIAAARSGDRATAMRLLQRVIEQDNRNETAWMWMASISTSTTDKRRYLQRVLSINPSNQTARTALERLGGQAAASSAPVSNIPAGGRRNLVTIGLYTIGFLSIVLITIVIIRAIGQSTQPSGDELTQVAVVAATQFAASQEPTTPAATERPSRTPTLSGILVTPDPATLPPTFTPTPQPTGTDTPIPSPTPPPLASYTLFYTSVGTGDELPVLSSISGGGSDETTYDIFSSEAVISPDGSRVAFVALAGDVEDIAPPTATPTATPTEVETATEEAATEDTDAPVTTESTAPAGEPVAVFVAPLGDLTAAEQLTTVRTSSITGLAWAPDNAAVVYVRDETIIEGVSLNGAVQVYVDNDDAVYSDPVFSPDGARLVYASDVETPGLLEI
ncbi:MAG: hypothetical protein AAF653_14960, partial [Chloroflexota bacterium]